MAMLASGAVFAAPETRDAAAAQAPLWRLEDVQNAAIAQQPLLQAVDARIAAAEARAVAAAQLPDPELTLGALGVPVEGRDTARFNRDTFSIAAVGLTQRLPGPGKRHWRSRVEALGAAIDTAQRAVVSASVQRDAGQAYLDWLQPYEAAQLVQAQCREVQRQRDALRLAYVAGEGRQSEIFAAEAALGMLEDRLAEFQQQRLAAQAALSRWVGSWPDTALPVPPSTITLPPLPQLQAGLSKHPQLQAALQDVARADASVQLASRALRPDVELEVEYGYRSDYADLLSLQLRLPLPVFAAQRQDRDLAAARAEHAATTAEAEDLRRQLDAALQSAYLQWQSLVARGQHYDDTVLPAAKAGVAATLAAYGSGSGGLRAVLEARQALLEAQLYALDLQVRQWRSALAVRYFVVEG